MRENTGHNIQNDRSPEDGIKSSRGSRFQEAVLLLNNKLVYRRKRKYRPEEMLLVCPHCLQNSECGFKIILSSVNCKKCGKCSVKDLVEIAERYGIRLHFVAGGRDAVSMVKKPSVKAIVAVGCGKELFSGLLKVLKKDVIAVHNRWPNGPCKDTFVDFSEVEKAVRFLLEEK
ncbi:DUF116 domain-containing protein [Candidatus Auribacterota bacterium]